MTSSCVLSYDWPGASKVTQGWEVRSQIPPFCCLHNVSAFVKQCLAIEYHVYIWQASPQLKFGDTHQIWLWLERIWQLSTFTTKLKKTSPMAKLTNGALVTHSPGEYKYMNHVHPHDIMKSWKRYPHYCSILWGIHWSQIPPRRTCDGELWCFLCCQP